MREVAERDPLTLKYKFPRFVLIRDWVRITSQLGSDSLLAADLDEPIRNGTMSLLRRARMTEQNKYCCVLVVEDDVLLRRVLVKTLLSWGYQIREAGDGGAALVQVTEAGEGLDAVVLDIMLPVLDGVGVAKKILGDRPSLPIVACSAALDDEMKTALKNVGVRHFLPKPYSADLLHEMLRTAIHCN